MVVLRRILPGDEERMLDILTDDRVKRTYMLPDYPNREAALPLFRRLMEMSEDRGKYVRGIALEDALVGFVNQVEVSGGEIELGYVIHPKFQGRGFMTEALGLALKELAALDYHTVIAGAFSTNAASIRCMEKCGMIKMETTDEISYRGIVHTCVYYRKTLESYYAEIPLSGS